MEITIFVSAAVGAWLATGMLIPVMRRSGLVDVPNWRSSHLQSTPRGGGLGIVLGILSGLILVRLLGGPTPGVPLLASLSVIALCGFLDDRTGGLPVSIRLSVQIGAALLIVLPHGGLPTLPFPGPLDLRLGVLAVPVTVLWIVGVTNLYNFLDGIDGFAALQGVIAGIGLALLVPGSPAGLIGLLVAGGCAGFLLHNWHPARIFMGDVGSTTIGFALAAAPLELDVAGRPRMVFAVSILLWFFLADGTFTCVRRLRRREALWKPHRSHLYQRLVATGMRHDHVTLTVHAATTCLAAATILSMRSLSPRADWLVLTAALASFLAYVLFTWHREQHRYASQTGDSQARVTPNGSKRDHHTRPRTLRNHVSQ